MTAISPANNTDNGPKATKTEDKAKESEKENSEIKYRTEDLKVIRDIHQEISKEEKEDIKKTSKGIIAKIASVIDKILRKVFGFIFPDRRRKIRLLKDTGKKDKDGKPLFKLEEINNPKFKPKGRGLSCGGGGCGSVSGSGKSGDGGGHGHSCGAHGCGGHGCGAGCGAGCGGGCGGCGGCGG